GLGLFGGVAAAESRGGLLAAVAYGPGSLALGRTDSSPFAVVLSGPGGRAVVGDADVGAICSGGPTLVFNIATGQGCFSDGTSTWVTP
ncbi:MAG: protein kinase, partial [Rhodococcus sp.]|nr:protein kinase [Rhodococcus sp. (in: high G+C Gram-positive bacteria)]